MRVVHVVCDLSGGGAERMVLELARRTPGAEVIALQPGGRLGRDFARAGIRVRCAGRRRGTLGAVALARMVGWLGTADVVHTHLWAGHVWGQAAAVVARVAVRVATLHGESSGESPHKRRLLRHALRGAVRVSVSSAAAADMVIPNGIELVRYRASWQGGGSILGVGRLVWEKGFDVLAAAASDLGVVVVGEGPEEAALRSAGIRCPGFVEDLPERLATASVVVVPSRREAFGLAALEAMAAGTPIVATRVGGLPEVLGDAALWVPPDDPTAMRQSIRRILDNPGLCRRLSALGRARAARFGLDRVVASYTGLYQRLQRDENSAQDRRPQTIQ